MGSGDYFGFDEDWARQTPLKEPSAAERDWAAKRRRWAALDAQEAQQQAHVRATLRTQRRRRWWKRTYPWLIFAGVAALLVVGARLTGMTPAGLRGPWQASSDTPPGGVGEQPDRILPPVTVKHPNSAYVVGQYNADQTPVTFSPCRAWPVVVNLTDAPEGAYQHVAQALTTITAASGLALTLEGVTSETADPDRAAYQPDRYGKRWAPILITWTTGGAEQGFAGHGGPTALTLPDGTTEYVTGQVTLDAAGAFNQDSTRLQAILLHELGHVVGLKHSPDPHELMAANNAGQTRYGPGDLTGLAYLGTGDCTDKV